MIGRAYSNHLDTDNDPYRYSVAPGTVYTHRILPLSNCLAVKFPETSGFGAFP